MGYNIYANVKYFSQLILNKLHEAEHSKPFETPTWRCNVSDTCFLNYLWSFNEILTTLTELENVFLKHFHSLLSSCVLQHASTECK